MAQPDNIFNTTQNFLSPELVKRFSSALGESDEKVQTGLRSVIPTFLSGLIDKGSTEEGAKSLVDLVEMERFDTLIPHNLNDELYLSKGEHAIEDIFGDYHLVADSLKPTTGLTQENLERMMEMIAPAVMGVLGNKIKDEHMDADHLKGFLQNQKGALKGYTPERRPQEIERVFKNTIRENKMESEAGPPGKKKAPFLLITGVVLFALVAVLWILSMQSRPVETITDAISPESNNTVVTQVQETGEMVSLPIFLKQGTAQDLPRTFPFKEVSFISKSTDMAQGGESELDYVANALKANPKSMVKLEAFIENTGDDEENLLLSENRAMLLREELIGRGIEASRIRAVGAGPMGAEDHSQAQLTVIRLK